MKWLRMRNAGVHKENSFMLNKLRGIFSTKHRDEAMEKRLAELRDKMPVPVFWLFGKTQTGKTSIIKYLTGAEEAEIGQGFKPCTKFSRRYDFPSEEAPLLSFLDTRGVDEPGYDPAEDLERFDDLAHLVVVTTKAMDHAQETIVKNLRILRNHKPERPVILAITCLHEAYPQRQHPSPYDAVDWVRIGKDEELGVRSEEKEEDEELGVRSEEKERGIVPVPDRLQESMAEQLRRFEALYDQFVPLDLTKPDEGFDEPDYGGTRLKEVMLDALPSAYRQTLIALDQATGELSDLYAKHALPHILAYSTLAATAGAIPVPWLDLLILPGIQTRMIYHLARFYGQPLTGKRFLELASALGLGMLVRQAVREVIKFIPYVGSVAGAAIAGASTFALGKAFCYYYSAVHRGQVPQTEDLKKYYSKQFEMAEKMWKNKKDKGNDDTTG